MRVKFKFFKWTDRWYAIGPNHAEHTVVDIANRAGVVKSFKLGKKIGQYRKHSWLYEIKEEVKSPEQLKLL